MAIPDDEPVPAVREVSRAEARAIFDAQSRKLLGLSGPEFLRRYDAGEFDAVLDTPEHPELMELLALESFGR
jgi:hypothetical protein